MCGIAGYFGIKGQNELALREMCQKIRYRGPDDDGIFCAEGIGLGHRRLSIIDTSPDGHQPMCNEDKTVWIVFNGEIYNYRELKNELKDQHKFKSKTDTEVIIHLYEEVGEKIFSRLNGMFAIALFDKRQNKLILARDRMGEKPLYYFKHGAGIVFASEPKALLSFPGFKREMDATSLFPYFCLQYTPSDRTLFQGIKKLLPGHFLICENGELKLEKYWDVKFDHESEPDMDKLGYLIEDSVTKKLVSDVPLGVFLSGGLDSSTIAYFAQKNSTNKIKTFSIGFKEKSFDESQEAKEVANFLGTEHHHKIFSEKDFLEIVPKLFSLSDEPLADASILPTFLLSQFTRQHVTVALGGDGSDELFCGYPTFQAHVVANIYGRFPQFIKNISRRIIHALPVSHNNFSLDFKLKRFIDGADEQGYWRDITWTGAFDLGEQRKLFKPEFYSANSVNDEPKNLLSYFGDTRPGLKNTQSVLAFWQKWYLADDILMKLDRASMYNSLETRCPFLDHRLVEYVNSLPYNSKIKFLKTKYLLKKLMYNKLPTKIVNRKKKGFGIPLAQWLAGPLKGYVLSNLNKTTVESIGFFDYKYIENLITDHFTMKADNRIKIWTLLCFVEWFKRWMK